MIEDHRRQVIARACRAMTDALRACSELRSRSVNDPGLRQCVTKDGGLLAMHLDPRSSILREIPDRMSLSGVEAHLLRAQRHLLSMLAEAAPVDPKQACVVMQSLCNGMSEWSGMMRYFARQLGIDLPETPRDLTYGVELTDPPEWRRGTDPKLTPSHR